MERAATFQSRAWSCSGLHSGASFMMSQEVKQEPGQSYMERLAGMNHEELAQQIAAALLK